MLHHLSKNISENKTHFPHDLQSRKIIHSDKNVGFRSTSERVTSLAAALSFSRGHNASSMFEAGVPVD